MTGMSRRAFLGLTVGGGAAAAAGLAGKSASKLIPYVVPPEEVRPGESVWYASVCRECPAGCGLLARHCDGRVVKVEGNPGHPVNRGGLCARGQSAVQGLYDPDRLRRVQRRRPEGGTTRSDWAEAIAGIGQRLRASAGKVALLSDLQTGALAALMKQFLAAFRSERLLVYEPFNYEPLRAANEALYGLPTLPDYRLERCDLIVSLAADFLETWLSPVQWAGRFAQMHAYRDGRVGRLVYIGPRLSMTAANADRFFLTPAGAERDVALALLQAVVTRGWARRDAEIVKPLVAAFSPEWAAARAGVPAGEIVALARALAEAPAGVALAGPTGATGRVALETALAVALLNHVTGRVGRTVDFGRTHALAGTATRKQTEAFLAGLSADDVLFIHNANPVYSARAAEAIRRAGLVVYLGVQPDETAELADWVLPIDSPLETWGDYQPWEGIHGLMQPTQVRLWDTRSAGDVFLSLAQAAGHPLGPAGFDHWLKEAWKTLADRLAPGTPLETFWDQALAAGGVWFEPPAREVRLASTVGRLRFEPESRTQGMSLWAWPSVLLFDGRAANRGWLQETPDPTSRLAWGSWIDLHARTAADLGVRAGDVVRLAASGAVIEAPVRVTPDVAPQTAAVALGQGHTAGGRHAAGRGANVFALLAQPAEGQTFAGVQIEKTGRRSELIGVQPTDAQHGRALVEWIPLERLQRLNAGPPGRRASPPAEQHPPHRDLYPPHPHKMHRWAMAVDLHRCTGCGACVVACCAENNIPVAGPDALRRGREMAWLTVALYRDETAADRVGFLPVMCQHCEAAPCEPVCPVFAAVHNEEGLNAQVYNRCIGTRYCSNNCPYKVRRFNWFDPHWPEPTALQLNPDVTVRCRGVMEKCTFCIQRIKAVTIRAKLDDRPVRDGEIAPACAQSCPTRAIVFGDLLDPASRVSVLTREDPRGYRLLAELNTRPAVTYLRRIRT